MKSAKHYEILEELDQSDERRVVYKAKYVNNEPKEIVGKTVVVKVFKRVGMLRNVICLMRDIERSRFSDHRNLTKVYGSFVHDDDLWVVMNSQHVASLERVLKRFPRGLPESVLGYLLKEVLQGLDYLHDRKWMHKNLDLGHVFVDKDDAVRIDFDSLAYDPEGKLADSEAMERVVPPEMLTVAGLELESDIWFFGIVALRLALGHIPAGSYGELAAFLTDWQEAIEEAKAVKKVQRKGSFLGIFGCFFGSYQAEEEVKRSTISPSLMKMVTECLAVDPSKRPTVKQLKECDFFLELQHQEPPSFIESLLG